MGPPNFGFEKGTNPQQLTILVMENCENKVE